jgi:polyferredoxin
VDGNRIFRACSVHFLTEVPVYGVPWYYFIPHILVILLVSFVLARFSCGWICPLGSFSEFLGIIRKWLGLERLHLSDKVMYVLKVLRAIWVAVLAILAVAIALPFIGLSAFRNELFLISCQTCPARNLFPLISGIMPNGFLFGDPITSIFSLIGIIFLIFVALGFFGKRIWCRFCPNGLILSWFNRGSPIVKEKDAQKCTRCGICKRVCPMDNTEIYDNKKGGNVNYADCIDCYSCVDKCPEEGCLKVKFFGKQLFQSGYGKLNAPAKPSSKPGLESKKSKENLSDMKQSHNKIYKADQMKKKKRGKGKDAR